MTSRPGWTRAPSARRPEMLKILQPWRHAKQRMPDCETSATGISERRRQRVSVLNDGRLQPIAKFSLHSKKEVGYARNQKCFFLYRHCQFGRRGVDAAEDYSKGFGGSGRTARQFIRDTLRAKQRRD